VRRLAALTAALAVLLALAGSPAAFAAEPQATQTSLPDIEDEVMCVVCGVPLELATESPQALRERDYIRRLINQGLTKDEIKDQLVAQYGDQVLAVPDDEGLSVGAWVVPGAAILVAAVAILVAVRRWRRAGDDGPGGTGAEADDLDAADRERLDADLARYDL
jgi:cytochrome c-type biogenesis protein CcmH